MTHIYLNMWVWCGWVAKSAANLNIVYTLTLQLGEYILTNQKSSLVAIYSLVLHNGMFISDSNNVREQAVVSMSLGTHGELWNIHNHYESHLDIDFNKILSLLFALMSESSLDKSANTPQSSWQGFQNALYSRSYQIYNRERICHCVCVFSLLPDPSQ